jgi:hypothetical protein
MADMDGGNPASTNQSGTAANAQPSEGNSNEKTPAISKSVIGLQKVVSSASKCCCCENG